MQCALAPGGNPCERVSTSFPLFVGLLPALVLQRRDRGTEVMGQRSGVSTVLR